MSFRLRGPAVAAVVAAVVAAGALAACSSSGSPSTGSKDSPGTLRQVLDHVTATSSTRQMLLYSRPKAAIAANGGEATAPAYSRTVGWGDPLAVSSVQVKRALGFDPGTAEVAFKVGNPPLSPSWLSGLATAPDPKLLAQLGAKKSGSTYRFAADNAINPDSRLGRAVPSAVIGLNVLQVDGTSVRFGASSAALAVLAPKGANLGDDQAEVAAAGCLGNPLAAMITNAVQSSAVSGFTAVGVGVTGGAGDPPTDQMCVATKSSADAQRIAEAVRRTLGRGSSHSGQRWSSLLKSAKVSVDGTTVKLTATPVDGHGGVLLLAVQQQDLPGFSG
jgi:hypothetical protein